MGIKKPAQRNDNLNDVLQILKFNSLTLKGKFHGLIFLDRCKSQANNTRTKVNKEESNIFIVDKRIPKIKKTDKVNMD
jgi:hypothetical protein